MRALVLGGGGAKGAFQVGALEHILGELEVQYDIIAGTSVGAINGSYIAQYKAGEEKQAIQGLVEVWSTINDARIFKPNYPVLGKGLSMVYSAIALNSLYDSSPLIELINKSIDIESLKHSGKEITIGAVSMKTGEYRYWDQNSPDIVKAVEASSAYPIFFKPVVIEEENWADGGLRNNIPAQQALKIGASEIDIITTGPMDEHFAYKSNNVISSLVTVTNVLLDEIQDTNLLIGTLIEEEDNIPVRILAPDKALSDGLDFNQDLIKLNRKIGYETAQSISWG